ncbi:protein misato [Sabethes cyaneus]|uniref:protein misato n=1 Tax=Sabethes cyaneus TaxID=53552 RepID=UPI00237E6861|nr:protein misato [Sabethes cyaneus]
MSREILTLQLGNYANYVGTHWWNLQEASFRYDPTAEPTEIDHDVLYREGQTASGQSTFTPRMLLLDLKGTLKFMPEEGELYEERKHSQSDSVLNEIAWDPDKIEVISQQPADKCDYQKDLEQGATESDTCEDEQEKDYNFKETVNDWIDYSYSRFHPRSINIVNQYNHSKEENQFDTIINGLELWRRANIEDEFGDKIRQYIEECDSCQGFQLLFDCVDGFAGLAIKTLEHLQDEYGKTSLVFPVIPPTMPKFKNADDTISSSIRVINTALTFSTLPDSCSLFVPLSTMGRCWRDLDKPRNFPYISYDEKNLYQTSGVLAAFLETASLRFRLKTPSNLSYLSNMCTELTPHGRQMAGASLALPLAMHNSEDLIDYLDRNDKPFCIPLTPNASVGTKYVVQSVTARGIPRNRLKRPPTAKSALKQQRMAAYRCDSVSEMLQFYYHCQLHASLSHVTSCNAPMDLKVPFPVEMFHSRVGFDGFLNEFDPGIQQKVASAPVLAQIQSSGGLADTIDSLHREVSRIKLVRIPRFEESGLESENYKESLERLLEFKERYDDNYEL